MDSKLDSGSILPVRSRTSELKQIQSNTEKQKQVALSVAIVQYDLCTGIAPSLHSQPNKLPFCGSLLTCYLNTQKKHSLLANRVCSSRLRKRQR
jgi:hypothetical protein